ncbi:MAG: hypothetical protein ACLPZR_06405 [Solirubrobacteraceae bacterium]
MDLPDVAWISGRDGTRAAGDLEDQAARHHPTPPATTPPGTN